MNKNTVPKNFTLSLVIVDAIPVVFFCLSILLITTKFKSKLFILGAILVAFAGLAKVLWKFIVVLFKKNIWFLFIQMRITMPIGLVLIIISLIINKDIISFPSIVNSVLSFPSVIFFVIGIIGMILMLIFGFTLDNKKLKNNWLEQIVNCIAQISFFIGLLLIK